MPHPSSQPLGARLPVSGVRTSGVWKLPGPCSYLDLRVCVCGRWAEQTGVRERVRCERERVRIERERVRLLRERVRPHVPIGALGVAVIWLVLSQHMPASTLPGASLLATAICLMRRCGYIHQRTLSRAMAAGRSRMRRAAQDG